MPWNTFAPMLKLNSNVALVVVDEGTEEWLTNQDNHDHCVRD